MATIAVFGQRSFGAATADALCKAGHHVEFVVSPADRPDGMLRDPLRAWADETLTEWADAATYTDADMPDGIDLIMAAHSHTFIGQRTRARARMAVGYHPSLLPIHRGRDAVRWAIHMGDKITGGSVYHLTNGIDCGPLAAQRAVLIRPDDDEHTLWARLFSVGIDLLVQVADDYDRDRVSYVPQDEACATWEPSWERPRLHRPELLELTARPGSAHGARRGDGIAA